ncbi:MAG: DNA polymerase III subunit alpha [Wenzhouxiangella sp.]|nr:DNA polymerase III subunit alpha [Wenzhouxiangella sp.]
MSEHPKRLLTHACPSPPTAPHPTERMSQPRFVHLRVHTEYALEDGIVRINELIDRAGELGMPAVAITDWSNLFGWVKFYRRALSQGIKPICGADLLIQDPDLADEIGVVTVLVQNTQGYLNLCQLISKSFLEGRNAHGRPVIHLTWLMRHSEGLMCLLGQDSVIGQAIKHNNADLATAQLKTYQAQFGDRLYIAIERLGRETERHLEPHMLKLAIDHQVPIVASNDVRFLHEQDYFAHEARVCIHQGRLLDDKRRSRAFVDQQYFKSPDEMASAFADLPVALDNTVELAKRCNFEMRLGEYALPAFPVPEGQTEVDFLTDRAQQGLKARLERHGLAPDVSREDYDQRLTHELGVIVSMGFAGYFLIVADFIAWARNNDVPVGPGRGSGAGSVVGWSLGITDVDPLRYDLLFERFLNPDRVSMPDFDIDFCVEGRDRVIDYVAQTYGRDQVSQIITYGTMAAKAVVRDCGRVLGYNYGFVDSIAKLIPARPDMTLEKAFEEEPELTQRYDSEEDTRSIIDLARSLEGLARNAGKHAGGLVIAPSALTNFTPLYTEPDGSSVLTQYDKNDVEAVGLVKFDFLGLRNLTIIDWALKAVNANRGEQNKPPIVLDDIPLDDAASFKTLQKAHTTAVFQLESAGMKELLRKLKPDAFDDIVAAVALYRPGPLDAGMVDEYINRKHGKTSVKYPHPLTEPILKPTYGVILYQEQVMQIAQDLAGYSLGQADILRRAMGKKNVDEMERQRAGFVAGAQDNGLPAKQAESIFDLMETFARYGFNKSHSVAYALIAYQTAWLKTHYPAEFMAAVLSADLDKTDKIAMLIDDCKTMGLDVLPPDINASHHHFKVEDGHIRYGLGAIKGVGLGAIENLIEARQRLGRIEDLDGLCAEIDMGKVNKRTLEGLIKAGAMDPLNDNRAELMHRLADAISRAEQIQKDRAAGQASLFGLAPDPAGHTATEQVDHAASSTPMMPTWTPLQRLKAEREALGLFLSGHPMDEVRDEVAAFTTTTMDALAQSVSAPAPTQGEDGQQAARFGRQRGVEMTLAGIVMAMQKRIGRGHFLTLDDGTGRVEVAVFEKLFAQVGHRLAVDAVLVIKGRVEVDEYRGGYRMVADEIMDLDEARGHFARGLEIQVNGNTSLLDVNLAAALQPYRRGHTPVILRYQNTQAQALVKLGEDWQVAPSAELLAAVNAIDGIDTARLRY